MKKILILRGYRKKEIKCSFLCTLLHISKIIIIKRCLYRKENQLHQKKEDIGLVW
jgi:hypothetical protein